MTESVLTRATISGIEVRSVQAPYRTPFAISSGTVDVLDSLIVCITNSEGCFGTGEVNPMTPYSGWTAAGIRTTIEDVLAPAVMGKLAEPALIHGTMDRVLRHGELPKAAVDIAVYDLLGKRLGVPVSTLLGGRVRDIVPLAWVVGLGPIDRVVEEAVAMAAAGFTVVKIKIGLDPRRDQDAVAAVRAALPRVGIRVDANQAYPASEAIRILRRMEAFDLEIIEQPVAGHDRAALRAVADALDTPVMADESLQTLADAWDLARERACDIFNIKIVKPGGLYPAMQIVAIARSAGIGVMVGSMPELGVATLAAAHLAATVQGPLYPSELIGPLMVHGDAVTEPDLAAAMQHGSLAVPTGPGLGIGSLRG